MSWSASRLKNASSASVSIIAFRSSSFPTSVVNWHPNWPTSAPRYSLSTALHSSRKSKGRILAAGQRDQISFMAFELNALPEVFPGQPFDMIIVRRGLCGLPYEKARQTIRRLLLQLRIGGKLYVSVLGLHSELGQDYAGGNSLIEQRFAPLAAPLADKYEIRHPVCLYTERNLFMLLLEAGASVLRTLTTTYGNVKGVAVRV